MADYKANLVSGYQRSYGGTFTNTKGEIPSITFNEEVLVTVGTEQFTRSVGSVTTDLTDPAKVLTLRSPIDDSVVGVATYQDLFVMMYSLYRQTADERDLVTP